MSLHPKLSFVVPVRDGQDRIANRVGRVLEVMNELTTVVFEVIVVDDGSRDATANVLSRLQSIHEEVRVVRHPRPRGMEAAGQTGLERATGEIIFVQESEDELRREDVRELFKIVVDPSVVAARAESTPRPISGSLVRRLRIWGTQSGGQLSSSGDGILYSPIQILRRPLLKRLASPLGDRFRLIGETLHQTRVEAA